MSSLPSRNQAIAPAGTGDVDVSPVQARIADAKRRLVAFRSQRRTGGDGSGEPTTNEPTTPKTMADYRAEGLVESFDTAGTGLEIGPSHNPITPKSDGYDVRILDHLSQSGLRKKYADHGVNLDAIEEVDYIWKGESYLDLVGEQRFDWIIASHVIEHVPDLVRFVNDCVDILRPGGTLALVVPDMRYCFDALRSPTGLGELIDSHFAGRTAPSPGQVADFYLNLASRGTKTSWHENDSSPWGREGRIDDALRFTQQAIDGRAHDVHVWRFTPSSFRLQLAQLGLLGLVEVEESFTRTGPIGEFYVGLTATTPNSIAPTEQELLDLALASRSELADPAAL